MKKLNLMGMLLLSAIFVLTSCSKDESSSPDPTPLPTPTVKMASLTGIWKASGVDLPEDDRNSYSGFELNVKADSSCIWTKTHKTSASGTLKMEGKLLLESTGKKDANGKPIDKIWFWFTKINGQAFSGSTHGIYQVDGNILTLDWEFMQGGTLYADPAKGFGSGASGQKSVSKYAKQ